MPLDKQLKVFFVFSQPKRMLCVFKKSSLNETVLVSTKKQMVKLIDKNIITYLQFYAQNLCLSGPGITIPPFS